MSNLFQKIRKNAGKLAFVMASVFALSFSLGEVADAYQYYDGCDESYSVYGKENINSSTTSGTSDVEKQYNVDIIVQRAASPSFEKKNLTSSYITNYLKSNNDKTGWGYLDVDGNWNNYDSSSDVCNFVPNSWANGSYSYHIGSNGVMYYTCSSCGNSSACLIDFTEYGYYDVNERLVLTGFTGYLYCSRCSDINNVGQVHVKEGYVFGDKCGTYRDCKPSNNYWHGLYIYKDVTGPSGKYVMIADPGYLNGDVAQPELDVTSRQARGFAYWQYLYNLTNTGVKVTNGVDGTMYRQNGYTDATQNGYFVQYTTGTKIKAASGKQEYVALRDYEDAWLLNEVSPEKKISYAVKITEPLDNGAYEAFGKHLYKKYHKYINFAYWAHCNSYYCCQSAIGQNIYADFHFNGKIIGEPVGAWVGKKEGYNYINEWGKCGRYYQKGYLGFCNDCGEMASAIVYASPETISAMRRVENGVEYTYICPYQFQNFNINGKTLYYLHGQVEQEFEFMHSCYATGLNQYVLNFVANSPDTDYFNGDDYQLDGYFYNIFTDGEKINYVPEGVSLEYGESEPKVTSKNTIPNPYWDSNGYVFSHWDVSTDKTNWKKLSTNTWKCIVDTLGASNQVFANDRANIYLRANWTIPERPLYVIDGDSFAKNPSNPSLATKIISYSTSNSSTSGGLKQVLLHRKVTLGKITDKTGTVTFNANAHDVKSPSPINVKAKFSNFAAYSGNKGLFDASISTYFNVDASSTADYIIANFSWESITLPTITKPGYIHTGWSTTVNGTSVGKPGAPYTPSGDVTLYALWVADDMSINANVRNSKDGISDISWQYNNSSIAGSLYYQIYRKDNNAGNFKLLTNGKDVGNSVTTTPISKTSSSNSNFTVEHEGFYKITLNGSAGETITYNGKTANGGKGAKYVITLYLKAGDKLNWLVTGDNGKTSFSGYDGKLYQKSEGKAGAGGDATTLYLTRAGVNNGQPLLLAVASGGAGGMVLPTGNVKDGGNAQQTLSGNGSTAAPTTHVSSGTTYYTIAAGGAGGGYYNGSNGMIVAKKTLHTHTAGGGTLVSGTALGADAVYSASGGCYTKETKHEHQGNSDSGGACYSPEWKTPHWGSICKASHYINPDGRCGCGTSGCIVQYGETYLTYSLSCNKSSSYSLSCTTVATNWAKMAEESSSTGGSCYRDLTYTTSASFDATNASTTGSILIESVKIGVTDKTTMVDKNTDDKAAPDKPFKTNDFVVNNIPNGANTDFVLTNINWLASKDNGTPYEFKGETYQYDGTLLVATKTNAYVHVTSGVSYYEYKITRTNDSKTIASGTTTNLYLDNIKVDSCTTVRTTEYKGSVKIEIIAVDNANNKSAIFSKEVPYRLPPTPIPNPTGHYVGVLETPTLSVVNETDKGIYKYTNTNGSVSYYVKANGSTKIQLKGTATLNPDNKSRITRVNIGNAQGNGYIVNIPLTSYTINKATHGGSALDLIAVGDWSNASVSTSKVEFTQSFVTTSESLTTVTIYACADCLSDTGKGCAIPEHELLKIGGSVVIYGDKTAPSVTIGSKSYTGEDIDNEVSYDWGGNKTISLSIKDSGSGIKSYVVERSDGYVESSKEYNSRTESSGTISFTASTNGTESYEVTVYDNVGNKTIVKITTKVDNSKPSITDISLGVTESDVENKKAPSGTTGSWDSTNVDTLWEYNWAVNSRTLSYKAKDADSGMKSLVLYQSNSSWSKGSALAKGTEDGPMESGVTYKVTTEGTSYYILEAIDVKGNKTTVYIIVRVDKKTPVVKNITCSANSSTNILEDKTMEEATAIVNGTASANSSATTWTVTWSDLHSNGGADTSGIASSVLYVYDVNDPTTFMKYDMYNTSTVYNAYTTQKESSYFPSSLIDANKAKKLRYSEVKFSISVNLFTEPKFQNSAVLEWKIVGTDNVGLAFSKQGGTINNYAIKAVVHATKHNGFNIISNDKKTSIPYFKTGEVGFVEVWTIGYVDKLELNFGNLSVKVPKVAKDEIASGRYASKYKLGSATFADADRRYITSISLHEASSGKPKVNGIPYATHYTYSYDTVNNSVGSNNTSGWLSDGTMIRIPPSYQLSVKKDANGNPLTDKYGNELYSWETHQLEVRGYRGTNYLSSKCNYVLWDEAGDDLHYRITHENLMD